MFRKIQVLCLVALLPACASLTSTKTADGELGDGLTYYLPKKDIVVTVVVAKDVGIESISVGTTEAYPDFSQQFVLRSGSNLIGRIENDIGVDANGLLNSSKSNATSGVSDALKSIAGLAGSKQALSFRGLTKAGDDTNCGVGTHTFVYLIELPPKADGPCGLNIAITKLPIDNEGHGAPIRGAGVPEADSPYPGIYYRQAEPYRVTVTGKIAEQGKEQGKGEINLDEIVFSPSKSPVRKLRVSRTFFSNGTADFTFSDGMPTNYSQSKEGELVALLKLPAEIIASYFSAIGSLFDNFKKRDQNQAEILAASTALELAKMKYAACAKAIDKKDAAIIASLECGK